MMDNAEEIMHSLEEFSKLKPKVIPRELEDYLGYVAKTGDPVFKWTMVKFLFREKMLSVINDFYEDTLTIDLPPCPNVDVFNYDRMKTSLLERLESFHGAPFTIQRICELLTNPKKEYNRADKFMRAIEKNILVVSTREPGRYSDLDCETLQECSINGIREGSGSFDTTFLINDLGPGPDSSSPNSEMNDGIPDANHLSTVVRVSPVHDQEVSSDSDDSSVENCHVLADGSSEKVNGIEIDQNLSAEESDGTNVSSTDMSLSLNANSSSEICNEETTDNVINPVSSSLGNVLSNQETVTFIVDHSLGEVVGNIGGVHRVEPCADSDGALLNELDSEPETQTDLDESDADVVTGVSKSDELASVPLEQEDCEKHTAELSAISNIEAVECDTSQGETDSKCEDPDVNSSISSAPDCLNPCDTNPQVTACDTTESNNDLLSGFQADSGEVLALQSDVSQSEVISHSDGTSQSEVIAPSDSKESTCLNSEIAQSVDSAAEPNLASSDIDAQPDVAQSDIVAQSDESPSDTVVQSSAVDLDSVVQSDEAEADQDQSNVIAQSDITVQSDVDNSEAVQSDDIAQSDSVAQSDTVAQSDIVGESCDVAQSDISDYGIVAPSDEVRSEPMAHSSLIDQSECMESEEAQSKSPDQTELVFPYMLKIPSDSENAEMEPAQSDQPDCITSEPMEVDD